MIPFDDPAFVRAATLGAWARRRRCVLLLAVLATLCVLPPGCAWALDRGRDALDVIDLKGERCMGLGVKAEATLYLGAGLGFATLGDTSEWYGRRRIDSPGTSDWGGGLFGHVLVVGFDVETQEGGPPSQDGLYALGINRVAFDDSHDPPMLDRLRFGGEVLLPFVGGGLYVNVGELADFLLGLTTIDIAGDDTGDGAADAAGDDDTIVNSPAAAPSP